MTPKTGAEDASRTIRHGRGTEGCRNRFPPAGGAVGEHTVMFAGIGERIELTHRATDPTPSPPEP